jgi:hypothetical protein
MSLKTQYQMKVKQREKRRKERKKLAAKGQKPEDYFYGRFYIKNASQESGTA